MKRILSIILTALFCFPLFACGDNGSKNDGIPNSAAFLAYDIMIQDEDRTDKCFWEDGKATFDDFGGTRRQLLKSATLAIQTEYDMWLYHGGPQPYVDLVKYFSPWEFEYNEEKIEIKQNRENPNYFIIKALQTCDKEVVSLYFITSWQFDKWTYDDELNGCGESHNSLSICRIRFTVSTEA